MVKRHGRKKRRSMSKNGRKQQILYVPWEESEKSPVDFLQAERQSYGLEI